MNMIRDVVEAMSVTGFAQVALVLFVMVFVSVLIREKLRPNREVVHLAHLPLADEPANGSQNGAKE